MLLSWLICSYICPLLRECMLFISSPWECSQLHVLCSCIIPTGHAFLSPSLQFESFALSADSVGPKQVHCFHLPFSTRLCSIYVEMYRSSVFFVVWCVCSIFKKTKPHVPGCFIGWEIIWAQELEVSLGIIISTPLLKYTTKQCKKRNTYLDILLSCRT